MSLLKALVNIIKEWVLSISPFFFNKSKINIPDRWGKLK